MAMARTPAELPPQQARSRETLRRLLDAAEVVLVRHGPERATLPRIAKEARLSPASVYRRFRDKDALMRAVFRRFAERSRAGVEAQFDRGDVRKIGLLPFSRSVIQGMVKGFRANAALSRAAVQYAERHPNADFVRSTSDSEAETFQQMVETFLMWRDEIPHPDPEQAIRFGFLIVSCVLKDLILFDRMKVMSRVVPVDDARLMKELPDVFLRCLGVAPEPGKSDRRRARWAQLG
jgi:AcrR family transcriptional regulator